MRGIFDATVLDELPRYKTKVGIKFRLFFLISLLLVLEVSGVGKIPSEYWRLELRNTRTRL